MSRLKNKIALVTLVWKDQVLTDGIASTLIGDMDWNFISIFG
ncbi:hypothetical protein [Achromobacter sp. AONIH1]|nr:hypothetical protein [Achromobacter sp. AONIH1]